jgi:hypothetical protein
MPAALMVVALFWGNCLSCPQMLLSAAARKSAHGCCKRTKAGVCQECQKNLQQFEPSGGTTTPAVAVPVALADDSTAPAAAVAIASDVSEAAHAPPGRLALLSSLRI